MYLLPTPHYLERNLRINQRQNLPRLTQPKSVSPKQQLKNLGVTRWAFLRKEFSTLTKIMHPNELLGGVVYGETGEGFAMMAATDRRVIFLDDKLFYDLKDEISYDVVSGVSISRAGLGATIILHTRIKDYMVRTLNLRSAKAFVNFIELRVLEQTERKERSHEKAVPVGG